MVLVENDLIRKKVSLTLLIFIKKYIWVLKQVVLIARVVLISSFLNSRTVLHKKGIL